jgi:hypothetical protein
VDESADKTSWYEWVAVGIYARKYILQKLNVANVGVVGIRDGGEVVWKLACATQFSCAVAICACGWKAYKGFSKFGAKEPVLDEERYRFIAGIDSQSYAPYVKCPVLMLCSTNDREFDYDRAFDTFSRINPDHSANSVISYSIKNNSCIGVKSTTDMFMFLNSFVKQRHVFIPSPAELTICVDEDDNLVAKATFDDRGIVEKYGLYMAEDCKDSALRDWVDAPYKGNLSDTEHEFYLNAYEHTSMLFAICYVTYSNCFTVWSKIAVKKISGQFRNSQPRSKVLYCSKNGNEGFKIADYKSHSVGGVFFLSSDLSPKVVEKDKKLVGLYSSCGLATYRLNYPKYAPDKDSILHFDICTDEDAVVVLTMTNNASGEVFSVKVNTVGKVWQSVLLESKLFKNSNGTSLSAFAEGYILSLTCKAQYAVNNVLWL